MGTFMNFLTSTLGQDILRLLVIGLTGGSGAAIVAAKKEKIRKAHMKNC